MEEAMVMDQRQICRWGDNGRPKGLALGPGLLGASAMKFLREKN
jgi:hypothetical protein